MLQQRLPANTRLHHLLRKALEHEKQHLCHRRRCPSTQQEISRTPAVRPRATCGGIRGAAATLGGDRAAATCGGGRRGGHQVVLLVPVGDEEEDMAEEEEIYTNCQIICWIHLTTIILKTWPPFHTSPPHWIASP